MLQINLNSKNSNCQLKTTLPTDVDQKYGWKRVGWRYGTIPFPSRSRHKKNNKETACMWMCVVCVCVSGMCVYICFFVWVHDFKDAIKIIYRKKVRAFVHAYVCVCVCVCGREREREREWVCVCVYVCMCQYTWADI